MKRIIITRHAKSSWENVNLTDKERPLNKRGLKDAPRMGRLLQSIFPKIGIFYSSPAVRAYETSKFYASAYEFPIEKISIETDLYFGDESDIFELIQNTDEAVDTIGIFTHNPTITYFVNKFSKDYIDNVPTCGSCVLESSVSSWKDVDINNTVLVDYYFPKLHL